MHKISGDVRTNGSNCLQNTKFRIDPVLAEEHHGWGLHSGFGMVSKKMVKIDSH
jgi:beta-glucanase (GH16 family)